MIEHEEVQKITDTARLARLRDRLIEPGRYPFAVRLVDVLLCPRCEDWGFLFVADPEGRLVTLISLLGTCQPVARQGGGRL